MKLYKYCFALLALTTITVSGCKNEDINEEHYCDNKLYVSSVPVCDDLLIKPSIAEATREPSYRIVSPAEQDIQISFDAAPTMTVAYNLIYNDDAIALDSYLCNIPTKIATIRAGDTSSDNVVINFRNTNELDKSKRYILPVTILGTSNIDVLENAHTAYFILKGAALINVVADIKEIYFPINWKSSVNSLSIVTIEALVRSEDWVTGRDNALNSVFDIRGKFLVRIGDADRPRDQAQVVAPGSNLPGLNVVPGLSVNEWVHITIVYDNTTKERTYYKNGVPVYKSEAASGNVPLSSGCYIGRAWGDTRRLPGDISEVRVWSVQRMAERITTNPYEADPASEGLVTYWKFDEGAGNVITDQTGHGNDITDSSDPAWIKVGIPKIN